MLICRMHPCRGAAFVAELGTAFGDLVDEAVSRGMNGKPGFHARENARLVGAPPAHRHTLDGDQGRSGLSLLRRV
jgi:hypothetical protein